MIINGRRSLAYIQTVHDIQPIAGADNIELIHVNAWTLIAKKGEFQDGDKCVFFEIDSKLPADNPAFAFLAAKHYKVKTYKLGKFGVVSQGLALPLSVLPEIDPAIELNTDVTGLLKVEYSVREDNYRKAEDPVIARFKKYKSEHPKFYSNRFIKWLMRFKWFSKLQVRLHGGKMSEKYNFPTQYVSKTDEERCLIGDTKILTNYGPLRIADIVNKGLTVNVASYNLERQEIEYKPITATSVIKCEEPMIKITVPYKPNCARKNTIICTLDHKFYVAPGIYKEACKLTTDDKLLWYGDYVIQTPEIKAMVYGMLLGDSSLSIEKRSQPSTVSLKTTHGEKQREYLKAKGDCFDTLNSVLYAEGRSGYQPANKIYSSFAKLDPILTKELLDNCYRDGKKTVTKHWVDQLTPLSLAMWYLDDGTLRRGEGLRPSIEISSCGFSSEEHVLLLDCLKNNFGIDADVYHTKGRLSIRINAENTQIFLDLIKDYVPGCMKYKMRKEDQEIPCLLPTIRAEWKYQPIEVPVIKTEILEKYGRTGTVAKKLYDITVADNHNFFANGILTHNCQNIPWVLEDKRPMIVTEKIDGTSTTILVERLSFGRFKTYICSRNICFGDGKSVLKGKNNNKDNIYVEMAQRYKIPEHLIEYLKAHKRMKWACVQGESYGEGCQGNPLKLKTHEFAAFNFKDSINGRLGSVEGRRLLALWGIPWVPIVNTEYILPDTVDELIDAATGPSAVNDKVLREGWVIRDQEGKLSFKAVSTQYLLKKKD